MNSSEFADSTGVNRASLSHVLSGRNKPGMDFLVKIINHFPNVNASWLLTGTTRSGDFTDLASTEMKVFKADDNLTEAKSSRASNDSKELKVLEKVICFYSDGTCTEYSIN